MNIALYYSHTHILGGGIIEGATKKQEGSELITLTSVVVFHLKRLGFNQTTQE